jgi:uncharacterized membrane protein YqjE
MNAPEETRPGVWSSLKRVLDALLATVQNRVELISVELQEEKCRLVEAILLAAGVAAFGILTLTLLTFTLVALLWDTARMVALVGLSVTYLAVTVAAWRALQARLRSPAAFAGTLEELKKDRSCLGTDN